MTGVGLPPRSNPSLSAPVNGTNISAVFCCSDCALKLVLLKLDNSK